MASTDRQRSKTSAPCELCGVHVFPFRNAKRVFCSRGHAAKKTGEEKAAAARASFTEPAPVRGAQWVSLGSGRFALVDDVDIARVSEHVWTDDGRCGVAQIDGRRWRLHRFVVGAKSRQIVDHANGVVLDCRRGNLRPATSVESIRNRSKQHRDGPPASPYKGVWRAKKRWAAYLLVNGKKTRLGLFDSDDVAAMAYDTAARELHGAFACVNFPRPGERSALDAEQSS